VKEFYGCTMFNLAIGAFGQINRAHATAAYQTKQAKWSASVIERQAFKQIGDGIRDKALKIAAFGIEPQQLFDFYSDLAGNPVSQEVRLPLAWIEIHYLAESAPALVAHR
jgi:hypothetical protein